MKKRNLIPLSILLFVAALSILAYGEELIMTVQFPFQAGMSSLPPGKYMIDTSRSEERLLILRNTETGAVFTVPYETRLSARGEPSLVFDKAGESYYLSEVYPANDDGFLLKAAPAKHTHVKVSSKSY